MLKRIVWLAVLSPAIAAAQQSVPFNPNNGFPVAPQGIVVPPLPDEPVEYQTAEGQDIRVVVYTRGLDRPFGLAFLPDDVILVTERAGTLRVVRGGELDPEPVAGMPEVWASGTTGLHDVVLHPDFSSNGWIYISYNRPQGEGPQLRVLRARFDGRRLRDVEDVFVGDAGTRGASRLAFGQDGMLYVSTGGGNTQDLRRLSSKVLRLTDEGEVPSDNPFYGRSDARPEIYTFGHRNTLGLAVHPGSGDIWQHENGPNGGDEINILEPGANYGWPLVSLGRTYQGPWQSQEFSRLGFENPIVYWMPSIAASGLAFYTGDALPKWKGDVFVGALRTGEIPGTGHLQRILFNEQMQELRRESLLVDLRRRVRDVRQGPDGLLYVITDDSEGAILRIEPG